MWVIESLRGQLPRTGLERDFGTTKKFCLVYFS
jgi:hypothetical protein